ncbi:hypothetical protein OG203_42085 [Nocardia sp. NBC_01499]|uniref:hypothetical protein n=1 Tax=Nocardia sp. NBC_01499 TaxID=2903597 RepID=UPI003868D644
MRDAAHLFRPARGTLVPNLALQATFRSLPDGDLRAEVQTALQDSELSLLHQVATAYAEVSDLIGLRPIPGASYPTLARVGTATLRGLILMTPTNPDLLGLRLRVNPFGEPTDAKWSEPVLTITSTVLALLEPDPAVEWTDQHDHAIRTRLQVVAADRPASSQV